MGTELSRAYRAVSSTLCLVAALAVIFSVGCKIGSAAVCGDGALAETEACDDGNDVGGDGCSASCKVEVCGDGVLAEGEECDDGNDVDDDGCSSECLIEAECGNGIVELPETCDDANTDSGDGCDSNCKNEGPTCGNLLVDPGENCEPPGVGACDENCLAIEGPQTCGPSIPVHCGDVVLGDTSNGAAFVYSWDCSEYDESGPELVYELVPSMDHTVTVVLTPVATDLDLMVIADGSGGCAGDRCAPGHRSAWAETSPEQVTFAARASIPSFIVVDTYSGTGPFELEVTCGPPPICGDGLLGADEQCDDGNTSSGDLCDATCHYTGGPCELASSISCGDIVMGDATVSGIDVETTYSCFVNPFDEVPDLFEDGPELSFTFVPSTSEPVTISLTHLTPDLNLLVLEDIAGECAVDACLASSGPGGTNDEVLTLPVVAGETYHIVVESYFGGGGPFTLALSCPSACEPACGDGILQGCFEQCDDGNSAAGDGCSATCQLECGSPPATVIDCTTNGPSALNGTTISGPANWTMYDCTAAPTWPGPEAYFEFVAPPTPATQLVRFDLSGLAGNLDLLVLPADADSCTDCVFAPTGWNAGSTPEFVELLVEAGRTYHVLVDSADPTGGPFTLEAHCEADSVCGNLVVEVGENCDDGNTIPGDGCGTDCQPDWFCILDQGPVALTPMNPLPLAPFTPTGNAAVLSCLSSLCTSDGADTVIQVDMPAGTTDLRVDWDQGGVGDQVYGLYASTGGACGEVGCYNPWPMQMGSHLFVGVSDGTAATVYVVVDACSSATAATTTLELTAL